jgi:hypothetical protein
MANVRRLHIGQTDGFDQFRDPNQSRPHVCRQFGQLAVDRLVHRFECRDRHTGTRRLGISQLEFVSG